MENARVMVCVTQQKTCERLILTGSKLIKSKDDSLFIVNVVNEDESFLNKKNDGEALEYLFGAAKKAGADLTVLRSKDVFEAMVDFALENDITHIVMGKSPKKTKEKESLSDRLEEELDFVKFKKL